MRQRIDQKLVESQENMLKLQLNLNESRLHYKFFYYKFFSELTSIKTTSRITLLRSKEGNSCSTTPKVTRRAQLTVIPSMAKTSITFCHIPKYIVKKLCLKFETEILLLYVNVTNVGDPLTEWTLKQEAHLEGVASYLNDVVNKRE